MHHPAATGEGGQSEHPNWCGMSTFLGVPLLMRRGVMKRGEFCGNGSLGLSALVQTLRSQTVSKLVLMQYEVLKGDTI